jgi:hypothetical protein
MQIVLDMHMHHMHFPGMTLDQFLTDRGISDAAAAERLGRDLTLIGRYRRRSVTPSPTVIADIVDWSEGAITPRELLATPKEAAA